MKQTRMLRACLVFCFTFISRLHATDASDLVTELQALETADTTPASEVTIGGVYYSAKLVNVAGAAGLLPFPTAMNYPAWNLGDNVWLMDDLPTAAPAVRVAGARTMAMADASPPDLDDTNDDGGDYTNISYLSLPPINTNLLYLQITNVAEATAYLNLNNGTNQVYGIYATPDVAQPFTNWNPVMELWPTNETTNVYPFSVSADMATNQFYRAEDWTGYMVNGLPAWWTYQWFGDLSGSAGDLDFAGNSLTLGYDYTNGIVPDVIRFSVLFDENAVQASPVTGHIGVWQGLPTAMAVLVNDTNTADADWQPYGSNIVENLTAGDGLYTVLVGVRGFAAETAVWQQSTLTLNTAPPVLAVTNPAVSTVSQPMIQIQGYVNKGLSQLNYAVSNSAGTFTGQGFVVDQFYDTNLTAFTTNYFQCFDVPLTNGLNVVTLQAVDRIGNVTTTNFNYTLDYSSDTTPPNLAIVWPTNEAYVSGTNFTLQAQVDDDTATVTAQIIDADGDTNTMAGTVERDGTVWVQNLPLAAGANSLTLTATDAAGNASRTNLTVNQSGVQVTVTPLPADQLGLFSVTVTGTVSDPTARVYVNGVGATVNGDGTWEADGVPVSAGNTALLDVLVYPASAPPDDGGGGGSSSVVRAAESFSYDTNSLPTDTNAIGEALTALFQPPTVPVVSYHERQTSGGLFAEPPYYWIYSRGTSAVDWADGVGGLAVSAGINITYQYWPYSPYAYDSTYNDAEPLPPVAAYPMKQGLFPGGTVTAQTALKTGGQSRLGVLNLYRVRTWVVDGNNDPVSPTSVSINGQPLATDATDPDAGDTFVALPGQATVRPLTPVVSGLATYSATQQADLLTVQSLTVVSNSATQVDATDWACVKSPTNDYVIVQANVAFGLTNAVITNNATLLAAAGAAIQWTGGQPVPGNPLQREVSKTNSVETIVTASLGGSTTNLNVWVIWATVSIQMTGTNPSPLSFTNPLFKNSYPDNQLGIQYYNRDTNGVHLPTILGITNYVAGKVCIIATITPTGIHSIITNGWDFFQEKGTETFVDGVIDPTHTTPPWQYDGPKYIGGNKTVVPDANEKLYSIDAPNIVPSSFDPTNSIAEYKNFYDYITWSNQICCETNNFWHFEGKWNAYPAPQFNSMEVNSNTISPP